MRRFARLCLLMASLLLLLLLSACKNPSQSPDSVAPTATAVPLSRTVTPFTGPAPKERAKAVPFPTFPPTPTVNYCSANEKALHLQVVVAGTYTYQLFPGRDVYVIADKLSVTDAQEGKSLIREGQAIYQIFMYSDPAKFSSDKISINLPHGGIIAQPDARLVDRDILTALLVAAHEYHKLVDTFPSTVNGDKLYNPCGSKEPSPSSDDYIMFGK